MNNQYVFDMIVELRGGIPEKCSFCDQPFDSRGAIPEEAGEWACYVCWDRWETQSSDQPDRRPKETEVKS